MIIEKGKTSNGRANLELIFEIALTLASGGYLTFFVSVSKNTIIKIRILTMYFCITTTSSPDLRTGIKDVAQPPSFYTVFYLALSDFSDIDIIY